MQRAVTKWTQCLLVVALSAWPQLSPCAPLQADTSTSQLVIRAGKDGLLSVLAHDHQFTPARWQAEVDYDPEHPEEVHVDVRIDAAGAPVVASRCVCSSALRLPTWDRKLLPVPFSRIDVFYAPQRRVETAERETARAIIARDLGNATGESPRTSTSARHRW